MLTKEKIIWFVKRTGIFLLLWFVLLMIINALAPRRQDEINSYNASLWILAIICTYVVKVWGNKESLLKKFVLGVLVWIVGTALGSVLGGLLFGTSVVGLIIIEFLFLVTPIFEKPKLN